jgi:hypothetical protein
MVMEIRPLLTLTSLPILVKSSDGLSEDGAGTLLLPHDTLNTGLHVVSKTEAFSYVERWKKAGAKEWKLFQGLTAIQQAIKVKDWSKFQDGIDVAQLWIPHFAGKHLRSSRSWKWAGITYADLMSNLLHKTHIIMWYSSTKDGNKLKSRLGVFCPDWEVAVHALWGMGSLRKCAKAGCEEMFIPRDDDPVEDSPNSQRFCSDNCGNADRVARWKSLHPGDKPRKKSPV